MPRRVLSDEAKLYVVQALARFQSPSAIAKALQENFDTEFKPPAILHYDPTCAQGKDLAPALKELFESTRERFLEDLNAIPVANAAYRLTKIQGVVERAEMRGNDAMVLQASEQAAKEVGGVFTNRRELTGKDGGAIQTQRVPADLSQLSDDELTALELLLSKTASKTAVEAASEDSTNTSSNPGGDPGRKGPP